MNKYIYLFSIFVLTVPILLDEWVVGKKKLRPYWRILILLAGAGLIFSLTEGVALRWVIWVFNKQKNSEIYLFGSHIETYLINLLAFPAIGAATLILISTQHKVTKKRKSRV